MRECVHRRDEKCMENRALLDCVRALHVYYFSQKNVTIENVVVWSWWQKSYRFSSLAVCAVEAFLYTSFSGEIFVYSAPPECFLLMMLLLMLLLLLFLLLVTPLPDPSKALFPLSALFFLQFDVCKHFGVFSRLKFMVIYRFQLYTKNIYSGKYP